MERRKNERLPIEMNAEVYLPEKGKKLSGEIVNISFGGALVALTSAAAEVEEGVHAVVSIILQKKPLETIIRIWSQAVHVGAESVGFNFIHINLEDFAHFKEMMLLNSSNPEALMEELRSAPGLDVRRGDDELK